MELKTIYFFDDTVWFIRNNKVYSGIVHKIGCFAIDAFKAEQSTNIYYKLKDENGNEIKFGKKDNFFEIELHASKESVLATL